MKLSMTERLILVNQYLILEALYPGDAKDYALARRAIASGYEMAYDWHAPHINPDVATESEGTEVLNILDMFTALKDAWDALPTKPAIDTWRVEFMGFDGNNEVKQLGLARYLQAEDKFPEHLSKPSKDLNSHAPALGRYRDMLSEWENSADKYNLTEAEIVRIASV
jgi:uncharacterized protein YfbU (UPF0304 family)